MTAPTWADVAASIDRAQRHLDCVPMPCVETQLAIIELQTAERWLAVPREVRAWMLALVAHNRDDLDIAAGSTLLPGDVTAKFAARRDAIDALLALAREAEGSHG